MPAIAIPREIQQHNRPTDVLEARLDAIRNDIMKLNTASPDVSVIIPAYNEEASILKTLSSLAASSSKKHVEIIVVNNNSVDNTERLAAAAGVICILETTRGVTAARNAGLQAATGKYILNADADTIYPPSWIDAMLTPLEDEKTGIVYGNFCFIPTTGTSRLVYAGYEKISDVSKWINRKFGEEAINVYGFNSAFRRTEGITVGGFDHPPGTNEDGWLAIKLRNSFHKKLVRVNDQRALVWTSDRRIQIDGGLYKAVFKRLKRNLFPPGKSYKGSS